MFKQVINYCNKNNAIRNIIGYDSNTPEKINYRIMLLVKFIKAAKKMVFSDLSMEKINFKEIYNYY